MNIRDAYNTWSATYDTDGNLTRDLDRTVTRAMLSGSFGAILETGCGTGKNTGFLAEIGERVYALDFSEGMMRRARTKVSSRNVTFTVADLTSPWPVASRSVDLVVCNLVLEHIEHLPAFYAEAARCLTDGGHLFVCELHPFKQYLGSKAGHRQSLDIPIFVHNISDFLATAGSSGLSLTSLREWWDENGPANHAPPRLVSFMFRK